MHIRRQQIPRGGDVIVGVNGGSVNGMQKLAVCEETQTVLSDTAELTIIQDRQEQRISLTLEERPRA